MSKKTFVAFDETQWNIASDYIFMTMNRGEAWISNILMSCLRSVSTSGKVQHLYDPADKEYRFYLDGYDEWRTIKIKALLDTIGMDDYTIDYIEE